MAKFTDQVHSGVPQTRDIGISTVVFSNAVNYNASQLSYQRLYLRKTQCAADIIKQQVVSASIKAVCVTHQSLEDHNHNCSSNLSNKDYQDNDKELRRERTGRIECKAK